MAGSMFFFRWKARSTEENVSCWEDSWQAFRIAKQSFTARGRVDAEGREPTGDWLLGWWYAKKTGRLLKFCYYDHYMIIIRSLLLLCFWWWWWWLCWCWWWWWWVWLLLLSFLYYEQAHSVVWQFFGPEMLTYEGHLCIAMVRGCITIRSFHIAMEHDDLHCYTH